MIFLLWCIHLLQMKLHVLVNSQYTTKYNNKQSKHADILSTFPHLVDLSSSKPPVSSNPFLGQFGGRYSPPPLASPYPHLLCILQIDISPFFYFLPAIFVLFAKYLPSVLSTSLAISSCPSGPFVRRSFLLLHYLPFLTKPESYVGQSILICPLLPSLKYIFQLGLVEAKHDSTFVCFCAANFPFSVYTSSHLVTWVRIQSPNLTMGWPLYLFWRLGTCASSYDYIRESN